MTAPYGNRTSIKPVQKNPPLASLILKAQQKYFPKRKTLLLTCSSPTATVILDIKFMDQILRPTVFFFAAGQTDKEGDM
jgi:hypothetical protein